MAIKKQELAYIGMTIKTRNHSQSYLHLCANECPINLTCTSLDCAQKAMLGTKPNPRVSNLERSCCVATALTTAPLCCLSFNDIQ